MYIHTTTGTIISEHSPGAERAGGSVGAHTHRTLEAAERCQRQAERRAARQARADSERADADIIG